MQRDAVPYHLYSPRAAGIDFYGDNLFALQPLLAAQPEMVKAFREASLRGWQYAMSHPGEVIEEKISLSERFGLWVSFYPFDQDHYLSIARHWVGQLGVTPGADEDFRREALQWALARGSRSGRVAWHFARDYAGRRKLELHEAAKSS